MTKQNKMNSAKLFTSKKKKELGSISVESVAYESETFDVGVTNYSVDRKWRCRVKGVTCFRVLSKRVWVEGVMEGVVFRGRFVVKSMGKEPMVSKWNLELSSSEFEIIGLLGR